MIGVTLVNLKGDFNNPEIRAIASSLRPTSAVEISAKSLR